MQLICHSVVSVLRPIGIPFGIELTLNSLGFEFDRFRGHIEEIIAHLNPIWINRIIPNDMAVPRTLLEINSLVYSADRVWKGFFFFLSHFEVFSKPRNPERSKLGIARW